MIVNGTHISLNMYEMINYNIINDGMNKKYSDSQHLGFGSFYFYGIVADQGVQAFMCAL